ncbi:hypothetical protein Tco_0204323, partial [Tanacetum coccineum]
MAEDEANSPYLRSYPLKSRPFRKDFKGKVLFTKRYNHEDKGFDYYPPLNGDEMGLNDVARVGHNMEVDNVKDMNDVGNGVNIDEEVLARQKKLDKGKENDNHISSNNESDSEDNVDEYADMYSESDNDESDKSFDYLSNGEDKVEMVVASGIKVFLDPVTVLDYVDDNGIGLSPLVRQYEKYMEALLKKLKGNRLNIQSFLQLVEKSKERLSYICDQTHCNLNESGTKRGEKFPTDKFKECLTYYALANGFSLWFERTSKASYAQLFNKMMEKIRRANPKAHENLVKKEPKTWSRAFSNEGICCEAMKNGLSKCFNYVLDSVTNRLWHVIPCGGNNFEVRKGCNTLMVDETNRRCSCRVWQLSGTQQSQVFEAEVGETSNELAMTQGTRTIEATRSEGTGTKEAGKESDK